MASFGKLLSTNQPLEGNVVLLLAESIYSPVAVSTELCCWVPSGAGSWFIQ